MTIPRPFLLAILGWALLSHEPAAADTAAAFTLPSGVAVRIVEAPFRASRESECRINGRHVPP